MCSSKPKSKTPAAAPPPADPNITAPARLFINRPKSGNSAGVRGLVIKKK